MGKVFLAVFLFSGALLIFTGSAFAEVEVHTVPHVDLDRYLGKWYEIAAIPQNFEKDCANGTTTEYSNNPDGLIKVITSCNKKSGKRSVTEGRARVEDTSSNAKLQVTSVKFGGKWVFLFSGKYWVVDVDSGYHYAVVGHPNLQYAWILSRDPVMHTADLVAATRALEKQGYDACKLMMTPQAGGPSSKIPLCDDIKGTN